MPAINCVRARCVYLSACPSTENVYYCPKCDRTLPKEKVEEVDKQLRSMFGNASLSSLRCPVCGSDYVDLDKVKRGGEKHVGEIKKRS